MLVFLKAKGMLAKYLGEASMPVECEDRAPLGSMLDHIDRHLAERLPEYLWNRAEKRFRGPVVITVDGRVVTDLDTRLTDGQVVQLHKAFVGG